MLDRGRVVDVERHDRLLERCPLYRELLSGAAAEVEVEATGQDPAGTTPRSLGVLDWVSAGHAGLEPHVVSSDVQQVLRSHQGGRLNVEAEVTLPDVCLS